MSSVIFIEMCDPVTVQAVYRVLGGRYATQAARVAAKQLQRTHRWSSTDSLLIYHILHRAEPYMGGRKQAQVAALKRFLLLKLVLQEQRQRARRRAYTPSERLRLVRAARAVREFNGGGAKQWRRRWTQLERKLEREVAHAGV